MEPNGCNTPSACSIACALAIIKSKPPEVAVRDYLERLRQHIAKGRRENALSSVYRYLDRSSFWRSEYERMLKSCKSVEKENLVLQHELEHLRSQLNNVKGASATGKGRKIKPAENPAWKLSAFVDQLALTLDASNHVQTDTGDTSRFLEPSDTLADNLGHLLHCLRDTSGSRSQSLCYYINQTASAILRVVESAMETEADTPNYQTELVFNGVNRATAMILQIADPKARFKEEHDVQSEVVHSLLQLFAKMIDLLKTTSEAQSISLGDNLAHSRSEQGQPRTRVKSTTTPTRGRPAMAILTSYLRSMIEQLKPTLNAHKALFEGYSYFVLEAVGPRLYILVFGHSREQSLGEQITADYAQTDEQSANNGKTSGKERRDFDLARLEAPYLIHLLRAVMSAAPAYLGSEIARKARTASKSGSKDGMKGLLTVVAKERLQRTLVNCVFGTEGIDQNDPFLDCLQMPALSTTMPAPAPEIKGKEVSEWFTEEVWKLLGWEILAREGDAIC